MIKIWNTEDELRIDHIGDAASIPSSNLEILCFASQLTGGEAEHHWMMKGRMRTVIVRLKEPLCDCVFYYLTQCYTKGTKAIGNGRRLLLLSNQWINEREWENGNVIVNVRVILNDASERGRVMIVTFGSFLGAQNPPPDATLLTRWGGSDSPPTDQLNADFNRHEPDTTDQHFLFGQWFNQLHTFNFIILSEFGHFLLNKKSKLMIITVI